MTIARFVKTTLAIILLCFLVLVGYQYWRVQIAKTNTAEIFETYLTSENINLRIEDLTSWQIDTLLKIQDPNFYNHNGIDGKTFGSGQTTITQSIVKRFYFKDFKKGFAKIEQSLIAKYAVHPQIDKASQITTFLNITPMGRCGTIKMVGFSAAATCYYQKRVQDLSREEFVGIVATLIGPTKYNPLTQEKNHAERVRRIMQLLADQCTPIGVNDVYYEAC